MLDNLVVKADDSQSRGLGFKPLRCIVDGKLGNLAITLKEILGYNTVTP